MKRIILIVVCTIAAVGVNAQRLEKPQVDQISGDTVLSTSNGTLTPAITSKQDLLTCNIIKVKSEYKLYFSYIKGPITPVSVSPVTGVTIKFKNGSLLDLMPEIALAPSLENNSNSLFLAGDIQCILKLDDLNTLKSAEISYIRFETALSPIDYEINSGRSGVIAAMASLFAGK